MTKLMKTIVVVALLVGGVTLASAPAQARWGHHHGWHRGWHHGWHHGGWRGFGWGFGIGFGAPFAYYPPVYYRPYYAPPCRWVRVRVWRHGYWRWRSVRRCW